jgi:hypothetical protein
MAAVDQLKVWVLLRRQVNGTVQDVGNAEEIEALPLDANVAKVRRATKEALKNKLLGVDANDLTVSTSADGGAMAGNVTVKELLKTSGSYDRPIYITAPPLAASAPSLPATCAPPPLPPRRPRVVLPP